MNIEFYEKHLIMRYVITATLLTIITITFLVVINFQRFEPVEGVCNHEIYKEGKSIGRKAVVEYLLQKELVPIPMINMVEILRIEDSLEHTSRIQWQKAYEDYKLKNESCQ